MSERLLLFFSRQDGISFKRFEILIVVDIAALFHMSLKLTRTFMKMIFISIEKVMFQQFQVESDFFKAA